MQVESRVAIVTFATTEGESPFNNYSGQIQKLKYSSKYFGLDLFVYTFNDLKELISHTPFENFPFFRRGVGGWFWKPLIILDFMNRNNYDYVLYMDVDCVLLRDPQEVINSLDPETHLAGFKMAASLGDWTASRVLRRLDATELAPQNMWTAGILIIKNSSMAKSSLTLWLQKMVKPANLFDLPFEKDSNRHRHDQSIFSILIAQKKIEICDLGEGLFSNGLEATSKSSATAWVSTGLQDSGEDPLISNKLIVRLRNQIHYRRVQFSKLSFWAHYFFTPRRNR